MLLGIERIVLVKNNPVDSLRWSPGDAIIKALDKFVGLSLLPIPEPVGVT